MKVRNLEHKLVLFWRRVVSLMLNRRGEGNLETVKTVLKYCACPALLMIDGIQYIVNSHYRQEGKSISDSVYRLMERNLHNLGATPIDLANGFEVK